MGYRQGARHPLAATIGERGKGGMQRYVGQQVSLLNQQFQGRLPEGEPAIWHFHIVDPKKSTGGLPDDLFLSYRNQLMLRENKGAGGIISPKQEMVMGRLQGAGINAGYWHPSDMLNGTMSRELAALLAPPKKKKTCTCDCHTP